jgi:hypothetical protein
MSVAAKKWARKHSPAKGAAHTVHVELAWAAKDDTGGGARLSYRDIAKATGLHRNTVLRALRWLETEDLIRRHPGGDHCERCAGAGRRAVYDIVMPAPEPTPEPPPAPTPAGQLSLLVGAAAWHPNTPVEVPSEVPSENGGWHTSGAVDGTPGVPQGTKGQPHDQHLDHDNREENGENPVLLDVKLSEPSHARAREAREAAAASKPKRKTIDPDAIPDGFPDPMLPVLEQVVSDLLVAAEHRGVPAPARAAVARVMMKPERARKPFAAASEAVSHWLVFGAGQRAQCRDIVARWRVWCDGEPDIAPLTNGNGHAPDPFRGRPRFSRNGHGATAREIYEYAQGLEG